MFWGTSSTARKRRVNMNNPSFRWNPGRVYENESYITRDENVCKYIDKGRSNVFREKANYLYIWSLYKISMNIFLLVSCFVKAFFFNFVGCFPRFPPNHEVRFWLPILCHSETENDDTTILHHKTREHQCGKLLLSYISHILSQLRLCLYHNKRFIAVTVACIPPSKYGVKQSPLTNFLKLDIHIHQKDFTFWNCHFSEWGLGLLTFMLTQSWAAETIAAMIHHADLYIDIHERL